MSVVTRSTCRVCGMPHLEKVMSLGNQPIAGAFGENAVKREVPLELVRCDTSRDERACGLLQLRHTVSPAVLYDSYWYRSGTNRTMTNNLHGIAQRVQELAKLIGGDRVLDIGCNDGTLFDGYTRAPGPRGLEFLGFDPSDVAKHATAKGYNVINGLFSRAAAATKHPGWADHSVQAITSIAMFYDLERPSVFVKDIASMLAYNGIWALELHYLPTMLDTNGYDAIVHEHLCYYSLTVLERLFAEHNLEVVSAETNTINGGSIRLYVGHVGYHARTPDDETKLRDLRIAEFEGGLDEREPYQWFAARVRGVSIRLKERCEELVAAGNVIHVYGASTKGNTILKYAEIDAGLVAAAADRNPVKWGTSMVNGIPIISEEESRTLAPDYYLVLPWHFMDEFVEREAEFFDRGGKFITPLPDVQIISP